ncbi:DNA repair exonuclease SbcCD nuclease subunit [Lachnospiraceae bacterium NE2001]|nr:DNA repair exonuclease SbcCD nuclease subunit [Lachnospiraceae bacterium NE2001]
MKILHTADIHLESKLDAHFSDEQAKERRNELLVTFNNMVNYAANENVTAIIIAGDLFDKSSILATSRNSVLAAINNHPEITFYYLRGNHDATGIIQDMIKKNGSQPENLKLFGDDWTSYTISEDGFDVVITGAELTKENNSHLVDSLVLDQTKFNIVTLHGQEVENMADKKAEVISLRDYRNRGIDYMALGHVHEPKIEKLDARGIYSYPGCLEGRGFDECGPRGFNMLTITKEEGNAPKLDVEFIPFAERVMQELRIDVADILTSDEAIAKIREMAAEANVLDKDMVKAVLTGGASLDADFDITYIEKMLERDFYYISVRDKTSPVIDYNSFVNDKTLKGEFVRLIKAEQEAGNLSQDDAAKIIRTGVLLLAGEEALA